MRYLPLVTTVGDQTGGGSGTFLRNCPTDGRYDILKPGHARRGNEPD
ncbi:MAG: hypothetical protein R2738_01115 [Bacteroides graminisolvens]